MSVGLTSKELHSAFLRVLNKYAENIQSDEQAIKHGENPESEKLVKQLSESMPREELLKFMMMLNIANAILDVIALNNEIIGTTLKQS